MRRSAVVLAWVLIGCGGGGGSDAGGGTDAATEDAASGAGGDMPDGSQNDTGSSDADDAPAPDAPGADASAGDTGAHDFSAVEALLVRRAAAAGVTDLGLTIWNAQDGQVFQRMIGNFTADTRVAVASASKMVSGLVLFDVIRRGMLDLDATTGQVLGWTGANGAITLRQLMSFTSGLPADAPCTSNPLTTLAACAATVAGATPTAPPGTLFDYGSTHLQVAAAMAEQATGLHWANLFAQALQVPLGLPGDVAYFTAPRMMTGVMNPLIAGGLRASINEYRDLLAIAFHDGRYGGLTVGTPALFDAQAKDPYPDAAIGNSPLPFRYGLTAWLECATPADGCAVLASPGAFGFTPWFDRDTGYYAILGMELASTGGDEGVVAFAVNLQADLQPLIAAALAP